MLTEYGIRLPPATTHVATCMRPAMPPWSLPLRLACTSLYFHNSHAPHTCGEHGSARTHTRLWDGSLYAPGNAALVAASAPGLHPSLLTPLLPTHTHIVWAACLRSLYTPGNAALVAAFAPGLHPSLYSQLPCSPHTHTPRGRQPVCARQRRPGCCLCVCAGAHCGAPHHGGRAAAGAADAGPRAHGEGHGCKRTETRQREIRSAPLCGCAQRGPRAHGGAWLVELTGCCATPWRPRSRWCGRRRAPCTW